MVDFSFPLLLMLAAVTSTVIGLIWDISWDGIMGKDSFWSPPHFGVTFGVFVACLAACGAVVQATRSGVSNAVRIRPLYLPLGAAFVLWGGCAVLASGTLELWWTRAYGLFPDTWSPPQILYTAGIFALSTGVFFLSVSSRNTVFSNTAEAGKTPLGIPIWRHHGPVVWSSALILTFAATATLPYNLPNLQRTALFYTVSCPLYTFLLVWTAQGAEFRGAATLSALFYTGLSVALVWILPLFPATPLIGPVYQPVTHLLPPQFPLLLVLPAFFTDHLMYRVRRDAWVLFVLLGGVFTTLFLASQWLFSGFLLSDGAVNWFFAGGGKHCPLYMQIGPERTEFWGQDQSPLTLGAVALCALLSMVAARLGLYAGRWSCRLYG
ncbi:MAG: hypothetical protein FJY97_00765 [candidate division Zixibacteria bacterium]|nr:hypothetical protein [candidate division Zixibacteria bacterium]